jgi:hypothetical protein
LMDAVMWMEISNARDRTGCSDEEMVPHGPAPLGIQALCIQSLESGPQGPLSQRSVPNVFPAPAPPDEGAFLPMPGGGVHDVAMGDQRSVTDGTAQGILRPGRRAVHVHGALSSAADISTLFGQTPPMSLQVMVDSIYLMQP